MTTLPTPPSPIATLEGWLQNPSLATREAARDLFFACGYDEVRAADYPWVSIFSRNGWPRWTVDQMEQFLPVKYSTRIAETLLVRLRAEVVP